MAEEETITTTAAERRLAGQLMFTGILLGAMFIAIGFLGFMHYNAVYADNGTVKTLTKKLDKASADLDFTSKDLTKVQQELKDRVREKDQLQKDYDALAKKYGVKPKPAPAPINPY